MKLKTASLIAAIACSLLAVLSIIRLREIYFGGTPIYILISSLAYASLANFFFDLRKNQK